ncbi:hypothetical protein [Nonomuraea sp. CA-141351]|uniref:hypothetical protein n=1 Tax=Nonomuraea sp. CA-141351 TaxID=3239996 RepID=UPI003D8AECD5
MRDPESSRNIGLRLADRLAQFFQMVAGNVGIQPRNGGGLPLRVGQLGVQPVRFRLDLTPIASWAHRLPSLVISAAFAARYSA